MALGRRSRVILGFFVVFGALPFVVLLLNSFMELSGFISWEMFTTRHWTDALGRDGGAHIDQGHAHGGRRRGDARHGRLGADLLRRHAHRAGRGRKVLDMVAWAPWAVPGLVMSLGFLWAFVWLPIYGTLWLLVLVFVARGLPVGSRFFTSTMVQLGAELEESARIHGGSWLRTFVRIWVPLLRPAILGAWILLFVIAVRVLDLVVLLAGPGQPHALGRHLPLDRHRPAGSGVGARPAADRAGDGRLRRRPGCCWAARPRRARCEPMGARGG